MTGPLPAVVARYLARRRAPGPWQLAGSPRRALAGAIVIPALAERAELPATLTSLAANPPALLERFLVVVVVNHRRGAPPEEREDNRRLLAWLASSAAPAGLNLAWIDAASPGLELPEGDGVGLARKLGLDLALERLAWGAGCVPLLVCLDADTRVQPDYLGAVVAGMAGRRAAGGVLPFAHRPAADAAAQAAIVRYELALRNYVLGLALAGSPYAYHTVGSTVVCRARAYAEVGGMNRRRAGEDFYFLQQLAKHGGVASLAGTVVHPSPRPSARVPFGTGPSVRQQLAAGGKLVTGYPLEAFAVLGEWLALATAASPQTPGEELRQRAGRRYPELGAFLGEAGFAGSWDRLRANHRGPAALARAFHGWFDALKTYRLVRRLTPARAAGLPPEALLPPLLERAGLPAEDDAGKQLAWLRALQGGRPCRPETGPVPRAAANRPGDAP